MKVDFDNTKIAFQHLSSTQLIKAYSLFSLMNQHWIVSTGNKTLLQLSSLKLDTLISIFAKPTIYDLFVGGETLERADKIMRKQHRFGVGTILDYGVEASSSQNDYKATAKEIDKAINFAAKSKYVHFVGAKLTGMMSISILEKLHAGTLLSESESENWATSKEMFEKLCLHAYEQEVSLFIDAEETWIQKPLDDFALELMRKFNKKKAIVLNTLQMYRKDRLDFLKKVIQVAKEEKLIYGIKLVRGAYMEKERKRAKSKGYDSPINSTKEMTDRLYNEAVEIIMNNLDVLRLCVATHNENSCQIAMSIMQKYNILPSDDRIHFSQLYGMGDHISYNMAKQDYNVSKYMPYGKVTDVIPYLMRRAEENTAATGQVSRELCLLRKEMRRRRLLFP